MFHQPAGTAATPTGRLPLAPFRRIVWLDWPNRFGLPYLSAAFVLLCAANLLMVLGYAQRPEGGISVYLTEHLYVGASALAALFALTHYAVRGYLDDIAVILRRPLAEEEIEGVTLSSGEHLLCLFLALLFVAIGFALEPLSLDRDGVLLVASRLILGLYLDAVLIALILVSLRGIRLLMTIARNVEIDLLQMDHLFAIANPVMRSLTFVVALGCLALLGSAVYQHDLLDLLLAALVLVALVMMVVIGWPVLILRDRIRQEKAHELAVLAEIYAGNPTALDRSRLGSLDPALQPDVLTYDRYVRAVWEWPFAAHWERIALFGLLPPITWVLAALVEGAVDQLLL